VLNRAAEQGDKLPIKFVYNYTYKVTNEIGVKPGSPYSDIKDLEGKKIGVIALAHDTYNFAQRAFQAAGVDPTKQEYIAVGQGAPAITALYEGRVDALVAYDIEWAIYKSIDKPVEVLPQPAAIADVKGGPVIAVRSEDVENRADLVAHALRGFAKSTLFSITNPEATLKLHWQMYPESKPKEEITPEVLANQMAIVEARLPSIDKRNFDYIDKWGEFNSEGWVAYVENILRHKVPDDVDPADFYTNDLIDEINDFDEQAVIDKAEAFQVKD
jgi:NitT/TauT family transport system substrate-binding protein